MDIKKRLTRRPLTAAFWLLLTAAMALLIGVGGALMYASGSLEGTLDAYHTSIAVRTDMGQQDKGNYIDMEDKSFYQSDVEYFQSLPYVEDVYFHKVSAAYSPSFQAVCPSRQAGENCDCYNQMMLVATVQEILAAQDINGQDLILPTDGTQFPICYVLEIEEILSYNTSHCRRTEDSGNQVVLIRYVDGDTPLESIRYLQEGGRYVICSTYDPTKVVTVFGNSVKMPPLPKLWDMWGTALQNGGLEVPQDDPEFGERPFVKEIQGSVEDFLADPDNDNWAVYLENLKKQNHSVPVIGTEALQTMHAFVNYDANITQGRLFTREEYDQGAKVCILEETLAANSGIALGDTITLSQYLCHDPGTWGNTNMSIRYFSHDGRLNNPTVGYPMTRDYGPEETFTVVGLYRLGNQWADTSYSFTPNTVFIPQKAQIDGAFGGMTAGDGRNTGVDEDGNTITYSLEPAAGTYGIYFSIKLKNGMAGDFETAMEQTPFAGQFLTKSQGSDAVQKTLRELAASTRTLFLAVLVGWVLMAVLYVLLYQGKQRRNLGIMRSLGATPRQTRRYLWGSGMAVCGVGITVGTVVTTLVMNLVQDKLLDATFGVEANRYSVAGLSEDAISTMITGSQLPLWVIVAVGLAQLLVLGGILYIQAQSLSRATPRKLLGK